LKEDKRKKGVVEKGPVKKLGSKFVAKWVNLMEIVDENKTSTSYYFA
jgi:hypothetical protein